MSYKIGIIGLGYVGFPLAFEFSKKFDVDVIKRSKSISKDKSKTEEAIDEFILKLKKNNDLPDLVVLLQPTSPFRHIKDIDNCIELLINESYNFSSRSIFILSYVSSFCFCTYKMLSHE